MGLTYGIRAICDPIENASLLRPTVRAALSLGWEFDNETSSRLAFKNESELPTEQCPGTLSEVLQVAEGADTFAVSMFRFIGEQATTISIRVGPTLHREYRCVWISTISNAHRVVRLRDHLFGIGLCLADTIELRALGGGVSNLVPGIRSLPSAVDNTENKTHSHKIADITLFPPGSVEGINAETLAKHGQVTQTTSGPILAVCEELFPCWGARHEVADALGLEAAE